MSDPLHVRYLQTGLEIEMSPHRFSKLSQDEKSASEEGLLRKEVVQNHYFDQENPVPTARSCSLHWAGLHVFLIVAYSCAFGIFSYVMSHRAEHGPNLIYCQYSCRENPIWSTKSLKRLSSGTRRRKIRKATLPRRYLGAE